MSSTLRTIVTVLLIGTLFAGCTSPQAPSKSVATAPKVPAADRLYYLTNATGSSQITTNDASLLVLDPQTLRVLQSTPVGPRPHHLYPILGTRFVYISHFEGHKIEVVDGVDNNVVRHVEVPATLNPDSPTRQFMANEGLGEDKDGGGPVHLVPTPDYRFMFSMNSLGGTVSKIDTSSHTVVGTAPAGDVPWYAATDAAGARLFVANLAGSTVSVVDVRSMTKITDIDVGSGPLLPLLTPDGHSIAVTVTGSPSVVFIDPHTLTVQSRVSLSGQIKYPQLANRMIAGFAPDGRLWVGNQQAGLFNVIDPSAMAEVGTVEAGAGADQVFWLDAGPAAGTGLGTDRNDHLFNVIRDGGRHTETVHVTGTGTHWFSFNQASTVGYTAERNTGGVTRVDLSSRTPRVTNEANPGPYPDQAIYFWLDHTIINVNPTSLGFG